MQCYVAALKDVRYHYFHTKILQLIVLAWPQMVTLQVIEKLLILLNSAPNKMIESALVMFWWGTSFETKPCGLITPGRQTTPTAVTPQMCDYTWRTPWQTRPRCVIGHFASYVWQAWFWLDNGSAVPCWLWLALSTPFFSVCGDSDNNSTETACGLMAFQWLINNHA